MKPRQMLRIAPSSGEHRSAGIRIVAAHAPPSVRPKMAWGRLEWANTLETAIGGWAMDTIGC